MWAIKSGVFDTLQTSFSLVDQYARTALFAKAKTRGMGIIVKRPIANAVWGAERIRPGTPSQYVSRARAMARMGPIPNAPDDPVLLAMGFVFGHPEVDTAIVGTHNPAHMKANIEIVEHRLPIPSEVVEELQRRFDQQDDAWAQLM